MIERRYDPRQPYRYVRYGRMSDPKQNKRSPDQQFATIEETLARQGYTWPCVGTYRDDAISGRYFSRRRGLQAMLRDIETGRVVVDLIVVDTYERLGRAEEVAHLRHKLFTEHGILVVGSDSNFADPTGVVGKAVGMVEQIRATENTRISRHNVIRGKKDAARRGRWPGGPRPFGYLLKTVVDQSGPEPDVYHVLEPCPREAAAMQMAYARAFETGEGLARLSQWWNAHPEIPAEFKPVSMFTMGYRLANPIYIGTLVWGLKTTGVVNDTRVVEANAESDVTRVPDFCPPLVSGEVFDAVRSLRAARGAQAKASRRGRGQADGVKLIAPQARGLTLKYLLTGLARCGSCGGSLRAMLSGGRSKAGRSYVYYICPRHYDGACSNRHHVPEDQLREAVISRVRARLFPTAGAGAAPPWLPGLMGLVHEELRRLRRDEPDRSAAATQELRELEAQLSGWAMTLGDPRLPAAVRDDIAALYERAKGRKVELERAAAADRALEVDVERTLDAGAVIGRLERLGEVLAGSNPTLGNLELGRHVERIDCYPDGRVEMRGTLLGLFEGAVELLSRDDRAPAAPEVPAADGFAAVVPRRRGRLRVPGLSAEGRAMAGDPDTALDPGRFAGLPGPFFWTESFVIGTKKSWAEEHAEEVYEAKRSTGLSFNKLAGQFGKTRPTIQHAWEIADARRRSGTAGVDPPTPGGGDPD